MKEVLKFLWSSIRAYKWYYLIMIIAPIFGALYKPVVYYAIKLIIDVLSTKERFEFSMIMWPFVLYLFSDIFLSFVWRLSEFAYYKSDPYVKSGVVINALKKVFTYRVPFFQNTSSGTITSKIKGLLDGYQILWLQFYHGITFWVLASITTGFSIIFINKYMGFIIIAWSLIYLYFNIKFAEKINALSLEFNNSKHKVIGEVADRVTNIHSIKFFANRKFEETTLAKAMEKDFVTKEIILEKYHFKVNIINDILGILIFAFMIIFMVYLKKLNLVTVGDFVFVFGMVFQFQENLFHLMQEFHTFSDNMGDLKASLTILNADKSEYNTVTAEVKPNTNIVISCSNICFAHDGGKEIFNNLNLNIKQNEKVGIVGYTGSGKTTLINLLLGVYKAHAGELLIFGKNINDIDYDQLRKDISLIPQDIALFHRNLIENIRYGKLTASNEEVIMASKTAHAHEFIEQMQDGYNTIVGERGIKLSGGQRQRIAIARAILKNSPVLILDEATSSLDSVTELYLQDSLKTILKNKTVIAIAHRLSTIKDMDRLIVLDQGKIVEEGSHDQLMNIPDSIYAKIWNTQYSKHI